MPFPGSFYEALTQQAREETERLTGKPQPRYRIRRGDSVVEVTARPTGSGWAFATADQEFVNKIVAEVEDACRYFWERPVPDYYGCPDIEGISDEDVARRIKTFDEGENTREARRTGLKQFPLQELPPERQRALIERITRIHREYGFERL